MLCEKRCLSGMISFFPGMQCLGLSDATKFGMETKRQFLRWIMFLTSTHLKRPLWESSVWSNFEKQDWHFKSNNWYKKSKSWHKNEIFDAMIFFVCYNYQCLRDVFSFLDDKKHLTVLPFITGTKLEFSVILLKGSEVCLLLNLFIFF
jgi:hypothetical protein